MRRNQIRHGQGFVAILIFAIGLSAYGCGDSATINPVVQLASLTVTPGTLKPAFTGDTTQYNVDLTSDVTSVRITAQPAVAGDTVTINGQATTSSVIPLRAAGATTPVSIVVSESSTSSRTYTVLLVRAGLAGNNSLENLAVSPGTLAPTFTANTQDYTVDVDNNVGSVTVTPTLQDLAATMTVNGQTATSGQASLVPLNGPGQSTLIPIVVTAQNGNTKTYSVRVTRGVSGNSNLQNLTVSPGTLSPAFSPGTVGYTINLPASLSSNVTSMSVTPTLQDPAASMTVNGQAATSGQTQTTPLPGPGSNSFINIVVTAQNGTQRIYSVNVIRAALGGNNNLQSLTVSPGTLDPTFNANTTNYTVDVASSATSVTVTPTLQDPAVTMTVNEQAATSGQGRSIMLNGAGPNTAINIVVTAPNGNSKPYTITVERAALSANNNLLSLTVSPGALAPTFNPNTLTYSSDVADDVTGVTVSATKSDPNAVMSGSVHAGAGTALGQATISLGGPGTSQVVSVTVTAPNGSSKTYTITVERAAQASNNNLQSLAVSPGSLTPAFAATRMRYTVNVESHVTSVTVTARLQDTNASMEVNGQGTSSGQAREIFLGDEGSSTNITIRVIPPNGNAKTYRVTVNRASNGDHGNKKGEGNSDGN